MTQDIQHFSGFKVVIISDVVEHQRSWRERWFSLPFRPFQRTKMLPNPALPEDGEFLKVKGFLYCNARSWAMLKAAEKVES